MACVAGYVTFAIGKLSIDLTRHCQHHARGLFLGIIVTGKIALHVAERALLTERSGERTHRHHEAALRRLASKNLQILRGSKRVALFSPGR